MSYSSKTAATAARSGVPFRVSGAQLLVELVVAAAGGIDHADLARVVGQVRAQVVHHAAVRELYVGRSPGTNWVASPDSSKRRYPASSPSRSAAADWSALRAA
jgi:hypothetical protein